MNLWSKLVNVQRDAKTRLITATVIGLFMVTVFAFSINEKPLKIDFTRKEELPFIKLINGDPIYESFEAEAFFLPTKYNTSIRIHKNMMSDERNLAKLENKSIFSELDKLRIFRTFTNRFTESEYWTISEFLLRSSAKYKATPKKSFIDQRVDDSAIRKELLKRYELEKKILFKKIDPNEL